MQQEGNVPILPLLITSRRRSVSLQKAKDILQRHFDCEFRDFAALVYQPGLTDKQGGEIVLN